MLWKYLAYLTLLHIPNQTVCYEDQLLQDCNATQQVDQQYNVHHFVQHLNLEICVFVGIGLKYYAIFVELQACDDYERYFLGICHSSTLEVWRLCSPELLTANRKKCQFKPNHNRRYHPRIHRRYCDFKYMARNEDCQCIPSIFANDLKKVIGMPTCYIPPLPASLCKYNICGFGGCEAFQDGKGWNVRCQCDKEFCESSVVLGTSRRP